MVIGASVAPKFVIVCGAPSSITRKFSFFSPVSRSPCCVAAITSSVTTGTSTEMDAPASGGFCCCGGGVGATGGAPCCCGPVPPCGPAGDCARTRLVPSGNNNAAAKSPKHTAVRIAFMAYPSVAHHRTLKSRRQRAKSSQSLPWRLRNEAPLPGPDSHTPHVSMSQICRKTLLREG